MHAVIEAEVGRAPVTGNDGGVDELEGLILRMSVGTRDGDVDDDIKEALAGLQLAPGANPSAGTMEAVDKWLSVEEDEEVSEAIVADMIEDLTNEYLVEMNSDDDIDEIEQGEAGQSSAAAPPPPPPYAQVAEHFFSLEDIAEQCGMSETSHHLRKAKLAWMSAHGTRATKQTCIRDYL
jgi:ribosomal protein L12E/L44/L45/RPP1/RPP2